MGSRDEKGVKLFIDTSKRFLRKISLFNSLGKLVGEVEDEEDLILLLDQLLKKNSVNLSDINEVEAKLEGESRVSILIGVAAANALSYALGIKKISQLKYPLNQGFT